MGPCHEARRASVLAGQCHIEVGGVIATRLEPHGMRTRGDQLVCELLTWSVCIAGHAIAITAARAQSVKKRCNFLLLVHYSAADVRWDQCLSPLGVSGERARRSLAHNDVACAQGHELVSSRRRLNRHP